MVTLFSVQGFKGSFLCWFETWVVVEGTTIISTVFMQGSEDPCVYLDPLTLFASLVHFSASDAHICVLNRQNSFHCQNCRQCCWQWCPQQTLLGCCSEKETSECCCWRDPLEALILSTFHISFHPILVIFPNHYFSF